MLCNIDLAFISPPILFSSSRSSSAEINISVSIVCVCSCVSVGICACMPLCRYVDATLDRFSENINIDFVDILLSEK